MKEKRFILMLVGLTLLGAVLGLTVSGGALLPVMLSSPFAQLGSLLRQLSLSGSGGNLLAWALLLMTAAIPLLCYARLRGKGNGEKADGLLVLLCPVTAWVLYKNVNPFGSLLTTLPLGETMYKAQYGAVVYVIVMGWLVLRVIHRFSRADEGSLYRWLRFFVGALAVLFALSLGGSVGDLKSGMAAVAAANTDGGSLTATYVFLTLHWAAEALPSALDIVAALLAMRLLDAMGADRDTQGEAAQRLCDWCRMTLQVTVGVGIVFHVLQMLLMDSLRHMDSTVVLPVGSLAFLLICMTAARIIAENKALREENDLYI